jgi:serine/threonine protein kinase
MEEKKIQHCDIKPENILLKKKKNGLLSAKIIDFNLSFFIEEEITIGGTPLYISPNRVKASFALDDLEEIEKQKSTASESNPYFGWGPEELKKEKQKKFDEMRSTRNDVWSMGIVFFSMFLKRGFSFSPGETILSDRAQLNFLLKIDQNYLNSRFTTHLNKDSIEFLIKQMLTLDLEARPTAKKCMEIFEKLNTDTLYPSNPWFSIPMKSVTDSRSFSS